MLRVRVLRQPSVVCLLVPWLYTCQVAQRTDTAWVTIPPGASVDAIAESLAAHHVVPSARSFRWYADWSGSGDAFRPGVYDFRETLSLAAVAKLLVAGVPPLDTIEIPAGITLAEAAPILESEIGLTGPRFWSAVSNSELRSELQARGHTIEGYLFPGQYRVRVGASAGDLLFTVTRALEQFWNDERQARLDTLGYQRDEIMTLASIVEGEVRFDFERPIVSSVYHNRLASGMRLQADPTVIYALGERRRLFNSDYGVESPYNTYLIDGLPPHPINQPSAASIDAALYPDSTDYLYFVAGPDGTHHFSNSYEEHERRIREIRSP